MSTYYDMMSLIKTYGFNPTEFKNKLALVNGVISGSAAVRVWFNPEIEFGDMPDFEENDIDIFIPITDYSKTSACVKHINAFIRYIRSNGWYYDEAASAKRDSNKIHYMPSDKIDEIYSFVKGEKKIQVVIVTIDVFKFLQTETDLSVTATYWNPSTDLLTFGGATYLYK